MRGCNGKMGQVITGICNNDPDCEIVAGIDISDHIKTNNYPVFKTIGECNVEADVVVDFASAKAVDELLDWCRDKKVPLVLCIL